MLHEEHGNFAWERVMAFSRGVVVGCRPWRMDSMDSFKTANQELPSEGGTADLDDFQDAQSGFSPRPSAPIPAGPLGTWQLHGRAVQAALFDQVCNSSAAACSSHSSQPP